MESNFSTTNLDQRHASYMERIDGLTKVVFGGLKVHEVDEILQTTTDVEIQKILD